MEQRKHRIDRLTVLLFFATSPVSRCAMMWSTSHQFEDDEMQKPVFYCCLLSPLHATETSRLGVSIFADFGDKFQSVRKAVKSILRFSSSLPFFLLPLSFFSPIRLENEKREERKFRCLFSNDLIY